MMTGSFTVPTLPRRKKPSHIYSKQFSYYFNPTFVKGTETLTVLKWNGMWLCGYLLIINITKIFNQMSGENVNLDNVNI